VQGGKPEDLENYYLVSTEGINLWVQKNLEYEGDALHIDKVLTTLGYLLLGVNAHMRF